MRRLGGVLAGVVLLAGCGGGPDAFDKMIEQDAVRLIDRDGMVVGVYRDPGGRLCFAYVGTRHGGGPCMVSGWAVETGVADVGPGQVLMVATDARATEVRVPTTGGVLTVRPEYVPGVDAHVAAVPVEISTLRLGGTPSRRTTPPDASSAASTTAGPAPAPRRTAGRTTGSWTSR